MVPSPIFHHVNKHDALNRAYLRRVPQPGRCPVLLHVRQVRLPNMLECGYGQQPPHFWVSAFLLVSRAPT